MILELNAQNLVTIPGYHTATDFFRPQLPRDLGIRQGHPFTQSYAHTKNLYQIYLWPPGLNGHQTARRCTQGRLILS